MEAVLSARAVKSLVDMEEKEHMVDTHALDPALRIRVASDG